MDGNTREIIQLLKEIRFELHAQKIQKLMEDQYVLKLIPKEKFESFVKSSLDLEQKWLESDLLRNILEKKGEDLEHILADLFRNKTDENSNKACAGDPDGDWDDK